MALLLRSSWDTAADAGDPQDEKLMAAVGLRPGAVVTQAMAHLG